MPRKQCHKMDERVRFVSRQLEGESISELCREFGISPVTGHKLVDRYKQHGIEAVRRSTPATFNPTLRAKRMAINSALTTL